VDSLGDGEYVVGWCVWVDREIGSYTCNLRERLVLGTVTEF